jgi:hypothetical protein
MHKPLPTPNDEFKIPEMLGRLGQDFPWYVLLFIMPRFNRKIIAIVNNADIKAMAPTARLHLVQMLRELYKQNISIMAGRGIKASLLRWRINKSFNDLNELISNLHHRTRIRDPN